jgi:hypothetical protein
MNNVRGRDELEIVLNKTGKETEEKYERLARLDLALKFKEKPVTKMTLILKWLILCDQNAIFQIKKKFYIKKIKVCSYLFKFSFFF